MRKVALLPCLMLAALPALAAAPGDWPTYGRDKGGQRHSPLTQITPANVAGLQQAWVYHMKPADTVAVVDSATVRARADEGAAPLPPRPKFLQSQMTPLVVDGRMFISTPYGRAVALDPDTGKELWVTPIGGTGSPSLRGVEYWAGGCQEPGADRVRHQRRPPDRAGRQDRGRSSRASAITARSICAPTRS